MPNYQVAFELRSGEANFEKIVITNVNPTPAGDERAYVRITKPGGTIIKEQDLETPDIDLDLGPSEYTIDIPVATNGDYLAGTYLIEISEDVPGDPGVYTDESFEFYWCPLENAAAIDFVANCVCGKITVEDSSDYGSATVVSRSMITYPPQIQGQPPAVPQETESESMTFSFGYANVKYQTILDVEIERNIITGVVSYEQFVKTQWNDVVCDYNFCELLTCVKAEYTRLENLASSVGGLKNIPPYELDVWLKLTKDFQLHNSYIVCGNYSAAQALYETIKDDLNCECGCGDANTAEPIAISPACGEEGAEALSLDQVFPVVVSLDAGVWTISLDETWLAKVNALRGHTHVSDSEFLDISQSYDGGTNMTTWTHAIVIGDWAYITSPDFDPNFQDILEENQLAYRLENATKNIVVTSHFHTAEELVIGDSYDLLGSLIDVNHRPATESPRVALLAADGTFAGTARLETTGQITIIPAIDFWTTELEITFQIIWDREFTWSV